MAKKPFNPSEWLVKLSDFVMSTGYDPKRPETSVCLKAKAEFERAINENLSNVSGLTAAQAHVRANLVKGLGYLLDVTANEESLRAALSTYRTQLLNNNNNPLNVDIRPYMEDSPLSGIKAIATAVQGELSEKKFFQPGVTKGKDQVDVARLFIGQNALLISFAELADEARRSPPTIAQNHSATKVKGNIPVDLQAQASKLGGVIANSANNPPAPTTKPLAQNASLTP